jgi:hypothetical protein
MKVGDLVTMRRVWFAEEDELTDIGLVLCMQADNLGDVVVQVQWVDGEKVWMMEEDLEVINEDSVACQGKGG